MVGKTNANSNLNKFDIDNIESNSAAGANGNKTFMLNKGVYVFVNDTSSNHGVSVQSDSYEILQAEETDKQQIIVVEVTNSSETVIMTPNYTNDYWATKYFKIL